ncbi:Nif3-like dinuclear metal center hexameric protein [Paenibacillus sp. LHD-117]|uniref:Nif3-like dinuclear metal center hexameric protein n=1 Tax=Paenibacillus sp. LHD-117 TaxID=3071412 RepID=UPI0027DFEFDB|nr:Nif3-like dinuclear metal center hexameric protein [Paenibacillus sp. LHD-117]MDQ6423251.1 Nif3-like dinuclear metal center hexameric protein [Paenibacillus sp. LHD-117]
MKETVQDIIRFLIEPLDRIENTVDTLQFGDPQAEVTGIVTAFMPTQRVIEEAAALGANLVIAHEAPFYSHHEAFGHTLAGDPVYEAKKRFMLESNLALFRLHDYIHRYRPDGIMEGLIEALDWNGYVTEHRPVTSIAEIPPMTVREAAAYVKERLGLAFVRVTGDLDLSCSRVGLLAGYRGKGDVAIPLFEEHRLDLIIYGEGPEWETPEYVRDAVYQGRSRAAIVLGHAESEEAGMKLLAKRLQSRYPSLPVQFLADEPIFRII